MIGKYSLGEAINLTREEEAAAWRSGDADTLIRSQIGTAIKVTSKTCKRLGYWDESLALSVALEHLCERICKYNGESIYRLCSWSWKVMENRLKDFITQEKRKSFSGDQFAEVECEPKLPCDDVGYQDELKSVCDAISKLDNQIKKEIMLGGLKGDSFITVAKKIGITKSRAGHYRREAIKDIQDILSVERKEDSMAKKKGGKGGKGC